MSDHPLVLKITVCANGETFEYRLFAGEAQVGRSVFLTGRDRAQEALAAILSGGRG